jgi:hypothetical protein
VIEPTREKLESCTCTTAAGSAFDAAYRKAAPAPRSSVCVGPSADCRGRTVTAEAGMERVAATAAIDTRTIIETVEAVLVDEK